MKVLINKCDNGQAVCFDFTGMNYVTLDANDPGDDVITEETDLT